MGNADLGHELLIGEGPMGNAQRLGQKGTGIYHGTLLLHEEASSEECKRFLLGNTLVRAPWATGANEGCRALERSTRRQLNSSCDP